MPLHFNKAGYTFRADLDSLTIEPGLEPISLDRTELEQIGLAIRDDYRIEVTREEAQKSPPPRRAMPIKRPPVSPS